MIELKLDMFSSVLQFFCAGLNLHPNQLPRPHIKSGLKKTPVAMYALYSEMQEGTIDV